MFYERNYSFALPVNASVVDVIPIRGNGLLIFHSGNKTKYGVKFIPPIEQCMGIEMKIRNRLIFPCYNLLGLI